MMTTTLFESASGPVSTVDLREALLRVGADECDVLYIHSGLTFGTPAAGLKRRDLLMEILAALRNLQVSTICMPTFTFSFCNGESFDRQNSKSQMGALNEFFRVQPDAERSLEPLMSVAAIGRDLDLVRDLGEQSIGKDSTFDKLAHRANVRFLFLGVRPGACFTYMHYLEWKARVPYRYDREFSGQVIDNGVESTQSRKLFVRYNGVFASEASFTYEEELAKLGHLSETPLGSSSVSSMPLRESEDVYLQLLAANPDYFITEPFHIDRVDTRFDVSNMVAL